LPRLLDDGADPNRCNRAGQMPLFTAALFGKREIISMLRAAGAGRSRRDRSRNTATDVAPEQGNAETAALLAASDLARQ
jgi:ankyrin repeat protein